MKTEFQLDTWRKNRQGGFDLVKSDDAKIMLYGRRVSITKKVLQPEIIIKTWYQEYRLSGKSLETFAVNILKALKSKKLKKP